MTIAATRVALFADLVGGLWPSPSTQLRFLSPWQHGEVELLDGHLLRHVSRDALRRTVDVSVFQRLEIAQEENAEVLDYLRRVGKPIVVDLDDDFLALQNLGGHEAAAIADETLSRFQSGLALADEIWVASEEMVASYARFGSSVRRRPTLPPPLPAAGPAGDANVLRLVYFGTQTHHRDWEIVSPVVSELAAEKVIACTLVGINPPNVPPDVRSETVETNAISRYLAFMRFVAQQGPFDVGIAPLQPDVFSAGKSGLKVFEYLELGLLPVASPVGPYTWLRDVEPLLAPTSSREWHTTLSSLAVMAPSERDALRQRVLGHADLPAARRQQREDDLAALRALVRQPEREGASA